MKSAGLAAMAAASYVSTLVGARATVRVGAGIRAAVRARVGAGIRA